MADIPAVGASVHYSWDMIDVHVPATILVLYGDGTALVMANDNSLQADHVAHDATKSACSWHFPDED